MSHQQSVVYSSRPRLTATKSAQSGISTTPTKLTYDTPSVNTLGMTISSHVFTATIKGLHFVRAGVLDATSDVPKIMLYKNGSEIYSYPFAQAQHHPKGSFIVYLDIGDTLAIYSALISGAAMGDIDLSPNIDQLEIILLN